MGQTKNIFSVDRKISDVGRKWFEVKIFTSNHFRTHAQREREIEPRAQSPLTSHPSTSSFDFDFESHPDCTLRLSRRTQSPDHAFNFTEIAPQDRTETAPIALRSQLRNGWVLMNLTGFDEFFLLGFVFVFIY